jgi:hypothetical protein
MWDRQSAADGRLVRCLVDAPACRVEWPKRGQNRKHLTSNMSFRSAPKAAIGTNAIELAGLTPKADLVRPV